VPERAARLRALLEGHEAVAVPGAWEPVGARLAEAAGARTLHVSGAVVSAVQLGMPDLGFTGRAEAVEAAGRVARAARCPVLADADTGFGEAAQVAFTVRALESAGVAGAHLEDQVMPKRCGHLAGKRLVGVDEATARIRAAVHARTTLVVVARTDALGVEGAHGALRRAGAYAEAGADALLIEGAVSAADLAPFGALGLPLVAVRSEAGAHDGEVDGDATADAGVRLVLHPVSAFLAAAAAALAAHRAVIERGSAARVERLRWPALQEVLGLAGIEAEERAATGDGILS